ncbi:molybdate ABC transporter substrate-binding protein [Chitinimonas arctica]|uniref:Molybdate ABC transporter substrate-binding protein n=1 Tax=Chitinimonas arctica TaxID=2594795 RepID=A0A516SH01_9NEIS|nr:molybdate ABC transporter substrate-binding protein [Chitinimonas arctica]QDQ27441.1 molybdate ABC transporter substrate-binding protein [Chitinimonas arctica]
METKLPLMLLVLALPIQAATLNVAAASDLLHCLPRLNADFAARHPGVVVQFTAGASGSFFAQIKAGAPYDVFLSADTDYPQKLVEAGLASQLSPYARGRIALWTTRPELDPAQGLRRLAEDGRVKRFAIANPALAPYGRAARAALEHAGAWQAMQAKLAFGENIAQTAQYVQSGNADVGIVSYSLLKAAANAPGGRWRLIPTDAHPPIVQAGVIVRRSGAHPLAGDYLAGLATPKGRQLLISCGFDLP